MEQEQSAVPVPVSVVDDPEPTRKRADAVPYISYKSLICTSRAVRHERVVLRGAGGKTQTVHDLVLAFAGDRDELAHFNMGERRKRVRYQNGKAAKEMMALQMGNLRRVKSDSEFNKTQIGLLTAIRDAQMGVKYGHVHECPKDRYELCSWDWTGHNTDPENPTCSKCSPSVSEVMNPTGHGFERQIVHFGEEPTA